MTDVIQRLGESKDSPASAIRIVGVDLASKYSAACVFSSATEQAEVFHSIDYSEDEFLHWIVTYANMHNDCYVLVEDLPPRVVFSWDIKKTIRMQGRIAEKLFALEAIDRLRYASPHVWQQATPGIWKQGMLATIPVAEELYGYTPPEREDIRPPALRKKIRSDYSASYLISRWGESVIRATGTLDSAGIHKYGERAVARLRKSTRKKKEKDAKG